ncbi:MAG: hypothetical protein MUC38_07665 [Cyclobacteriaceae bacterium]|jgi:hypothetical protein|nr:hypothetical protein [Cyclobacteriaceae bacterium]
MQENAAPWTGLVNQLFELEQRLKPKKEIIDTTRQFDRIRIHLEELGIKYHNPANEGYQETRTDCEASVVGDYLEGKMVISRVIKPIIYRVVESKTVILQRAIVVVESCKDQ